METCDVAVIGGGVIGQAIAYQLLRERADLRIRILERDTTYGRASSELSVGGIRQQFGLRVNIAVARESVRFYERVREHLGPQAEVGFHQNGYLFLASEGTWPILRARAELGRSLGVPVELLSPDDASRLVPGLWLDDIVGATYCPTDGYLDPHSVLEAFRGAARGLGARVVPGEASGLRMRGDRVAAVEIAGGGEISADLFVLAAGAFSAPLAAGLGFDLPVRPLRRQVHVVTPRAPLPPSIPLTIDPSGLHFRPEAGSRLLVADRTSRDGFDLPLEWDRQAFLEELWPRLARRVPALSELRLETGWAGYYDENRLDHNAIVGRVPGVANAYLATGFSGHGLMQCPAVTRGLAELMLHGAYRTLDLGPLSPERFARGELLVEPAVI